MLGGKRYCRDRNAMSPKVCEGGEGSGTVYESWGLCVLAGGGGRIYCEERAGETENCFGAGEEGAGVCSAAGLGVTSFGGKSSCGERVVAGKNICVPEYLFMGISG